MRHAAKTFARMPRVQQPPLILVAGPTASGKSALALRLHEVLRELGGVTVINADSMQVYRDLRILTARPSPEDEARAPHRLYGVRDAAEAASAAWWRDQAEAAITAVSDVAGTGASPGNAAAPVSPRYAAPGSDDPSLDAPSMSKSAPGVPAPHAAGRVPVICGGTGLYFQALLHGLAAVPPISDEARAEARGLLEREGAPALHARLAQVDPDTAMRLRPGDSQRLARAWEVWRSTGRGLSQWQAEPVPDPPPARRVLSILLDPPRDELRAALRARWDAMLRVGAAEEVRALVSRGLDPALPAMRAHGVPELAAVLRGEMRLENAGDRACANIGQYTKRQATWFRHHPLSPTAAHTIHARYTGVEQLSESLRQKILSFVEGAR